jgi:hypothetical protein
VNSVHATSQVRFEETDTERQRDPIRLRFKLGEHLPPVLPNARTAAEFKTQKQESPSWSSNYWKAARRSNRLRQVTLANTRDRWLRFCVGHGVPKEHFGGAE